MKESRTIMILGVACCLLALVATSSGESKPEIKEISPERIKSIGDDVEFDCVVQNKGENSVLWLKYNHMATEPIVIAGNGVKLLGDERYEVTVEKNQNYKLKIKNLKDSDMGKYECKIQVYGSESVSRFVLLQMNRPPKIFHNVTQTIKVVENSSVELNCQVDGFPVPSIVWKKEDNVLLPTGRSSYKGNVLKIEKVNKVHRGIYYCMASNTVKDAQGFPITDQANVTLKVEFAPVVKAERPVVVQFRNFEVKLECKIEALPAPNVTWYDKNNRVVKEITLDTDSDVNVDTLVIPSIDENSLGLYKCRAENKYGSAETMFRVDVYEGEP